MPFTDRSKVELWEERNGKRFLTSGTSRPIYRASVINGNPVIRFDGLDDYFQGDGILDFSGLTGLTFYAVLNLNTVGGPPVNRAIITRDGTGDRGWSLFSANGKMGFIISTGPTTRVRRNGLTNIIGSFVLASCVFEGSIEQSIFIDGFEDDGTIDGTIPASVANSGPTAKIGDFTFGNSNFFSGDLAEVLIYRRKLSTLEMSDIETYLINKYFPFSSSFAMGSLGDSMG